MATKSGQHEPEKAEVIEELLDAVDAALDRVKVLYEQYFLGIRKQPPAYLHTDVERKLRDLAQLQIRNTALRYRFATLQQKFGSYNTYWRRTLRQIENGTYTRNLFKIGRHAARTGAAVPEEILAAMPRRMREQVVRDREAVLALARVRDPRPHDDDDIPILADEDVELDAGDLGDDLDATAFIRESAEVRHDVLRAGGVHRIDEADAEFDVDAFFASVIREDDPPPREPATAPGRAAPPPGSVDPPRDARPGPPPTTRPDPPRPAAPAPSQATRPLRIAPGAAAARAPSAVETLAGPFPRTPPPPPARDDPRGAPPNRPSPPEPAPSTPRPPPRATAPQPAPDERGAPEPGLALPPGMSAAEVDALYAKYITAKQILGEELEPGAYDKLLETLHTQAPRIMAQYQSNGVDFSVAVKDNQVIIRAKPKP